MAQRSIRLEFQEHRVLCPHCSVMLIYHTLEVVLTDVQKTCLKCRQTFLIEDGVGKKLKKRPQRARV